MVAYNFKSIHAVPPGKEIIDIVLSKTQRGTPTVIHAGYKIQRIRAFYMRKVKFTAETIHERLQQILDEFPKLDDMHPFYADLCNVLYDRDHYKLALGSLNIAKHLVMNVSRDSIRMLKYADTLYRAKSLKRAALGRMCTILKKQSASFSYLEEVRKHLSRLPSVDPSARTLLICGFPNVGKSSFMNQVTNADVEVQPYAFTTKSLFVGHMDYKTLRWQVIDSPGVLDRALEERTVIEMQAITALAHLNCCVMYFFDASETCGWSLTEQMTLFESLRPLFAAKPLVMVVNKVDAVPLESLPADKRAALERLSAECKAPLLPMSAMNAVGIAAVKKAACEALLERRVEQKTRSATKMSSVLNRLTVTLPKERDDSARPVSIPESVLAARAERARAEDEARAKFRAERRGEFQDELDAQEAEDAEAAKAAASIKSFHGVSAKEEMWANGGPGVYSVDLRRHFMLHNPEWVGDTLPEFLDGKNVADFIDPDIERRLEELEREEEELAKDHQAMLDEDALDSDLDEEEEELSRQIHEARRRARLESRLAQRRARAKMPRNTSLRHVGLDERNAELADVGYDVPEPMDDDNGGEEEQAEPRLGAKRKRSASVGKSSRRGEEEEEEGDMDVAEGGVSAKALRKEVKRARAAHERPRDLTDPNLSRRGIRTGEVYRDPIQKQIAKEKTLRAMSRFRFTGRAGEADHHPRPKLIKHLVAGKMSMGTKSHR